MKKENKNKDIKSMKLLINLGMVWGTKINKIINKFQYNQIDKIGKERKEERKKKD